MPRFTAKTAPINEELDGSSAEAIVRTPDRGIVSLKNRHVVLPKDKDLVSYGGKRAFGMGCGVNESSLRATDSHRPMAPIDSAPAHPVAPASAPVNAALPEEAEWHPRTAEPFHSGLNPYDSLPPHAQDTHLARPSGADMYSGPRPPPFNPEAAQDIVESSRNPNYNAFQTPVNLESLEATEAELRELELLERLRDCDAETDMLSVASSQFAAEDPHHVAARFSMTVQREVPDVEMSVKAGVHVSAVFGPETPLVKRLAFEATCAALMAQVKHDGDHRVVVPWSNMRAELVRKFWQRFLKEENSLLHSHTSALKANLETLLEASFRESEQQSLEQQKLQQQLLQHQHALQQQQLAQQLAQQRAFELQQQQQIQQLQQEQLVQQQARQALQERQQLAELQQQQQLAELQQQQQLERQKHQYEMLQQQAYERQKQQQQQERQAQLAHLEQLQHLQSQQSTQGTPPRPSQGTMQRDGGGVGRANVMSLPVHKMNLGPDESPRIIRAPNSQSSTLSAAREAALRPPSSNNGRNLAASEPPDLGSLWVGDRLVSGGRDVAGGNDTSEEEYLAYLESLEEEPVAPSSLSAARATVLHQSQPHHPHPH